MTATLFQLKPDVVSALDKLTPVLRAQAEAWAFNIEPRAIKTVEIGKRFTGKPAVFSNEGTGEYWAALPELYKAEERMQRALLAPFDTRGREYMPGPFARALRSVYRMF